MQETSVQFLGRKIRWRTDRLPTPVFLGFPDGSAGKQSACSAGDLGSIPGLGRIPGGGKGYPLQYSGLKNSMECIVHGVTKSQTQLRDFHNSLWEPFFICTMTHSQNPLWSRKRARNFGSIFAECLHKPLPPCSFLISYRAKNKWNGVSKGCLHKLKRKQIQ